MLTHLCAIVGQHGSKRATHNLRPVDDRDPFVLQPVTPGQFGVVHPRHQGMRLDEQECPALRPAYLDRLQNLHNCERSTGKDALLSLSLVDITLVEVQGISVETGQALHVFRDVHL